MKLSHLIRISLLCAALGGKQLSLTAAEPTLTVPVTAPAAGTPVAPKPSSPKPDGFVRVPFVNGKPDPNFMLPSGITFGKSREIEQLLAAEFASSEEVRQALREINDLMDRAEGAAVESLATKRPEDRDALIKYLEYRKAQRAKNVSRPTAK